MEMLPSVAYPPSDRILQVEVINLAMLYTPLLLGGIQYVGPAFDTAIAHIRELYPRLNITQTYLRPNFPKLTNGYFTNEEWMSHVIMLNELPAYYFSSRRTQAGKFDLTVVAASALDDPNGALPATMSELDTLIITSVGSRPLTRIYPQWVTTSILAFPAFGRMYVNLIRTFNWTHLAFICDVNSNGFFPTFSANLRDTLAQSPSNVVTYIKINSTKPVDYAYILSDIVSKFSRESAGFLSQLSAFLDIPHHFKPSWWTTAVELNMNSGEYVFLAFLPFRHQSFGPFKWTADEQTRNVSLNISKSLLIIEPIQPTESNTHDLFHRFRELSKEVYSYTYGPKEEITPYVTSTYIGMMAFAEVAEELRLTDPWNSHHFTGKHVFKLFLNRTFSSKIGDNTFNDKGALVPRMSVTQTDGLSGNITIVLEQDAEFGDLRQTSSIQWASTWPVPNEPKCGFLGDAVACQITADRSNDTLHYGLAFGVISSITVFAVAANFKKRIISRDLLANDDWWRLSVDHFQFHCTGSDLSFDANFVHLFRAWSTM